MKGRSMREEKDVWERGRERRGEACFFASWILGGEQENKRELEWEGAGFVEEVVGYVILLSLVYKEIRSWGQFPFFGSHSRVALSWEIMLINRNLTNRKENKEQKF